MNQNNNENDNNNDDNNKIPTLNSLSKTTIQNNESTKLSIDNSKISPIQNNIPMTPERYRLERVSKFTGLHPNYLLYELSLDPNYRLPINDIENKIRKLQDYNNFLLIESQLTPQEVTQILRNNPILASEIIKDQMLRMMGDRLIGSMILSSLNTFNEVFL